MDEIQDDIQVAFREAHEKDINFIFSSWLISYKNQSDFTKNIRDTIYYSRHHKIIEDILKRPTTKVAIAHYLEDPNNILCYAVVEKIDTHHIIHFIFTKHIFRKFGIAKKLLNFMGVQMDGLQFTHWTFKTSKYFEAHPEIREIVIYNPYAI